MQTKKVKIVLLPTKDRTYITSPPASDGVKLMWAGDDYNDYVNEHEHKWQQNHIYITSDDEIKEGDWFIEYHYDKTNVVQCDKQNRSVVNTHQTKNHKAFKIIATTNKSISAPTMGGIVTSNVTLHRRLPQIPQSFIEKYCKKQVDEVLVEYLRGSGGHYDEKDKWHWKLLAPRVDSNNTINILPIKDSWSRGEVIDTLSKYIHDSSTFHAEKFNDWIEGNLF